MDMQIKKYAKEYAKDRAFARRLLINVIGIVVLITMTVAYAIAKTGDEPTESFSIDEESLDNTYVSDYGQGDAGGYETDTGGHEVDAGSYEANAGNYEEDTSGYEVDAGSYEVNTGNYEEDTGSYEVSIDSNEEDREKYWDNVEVFLRYYYEGDVDDLLKCAGLYTHTKIPDITLDISIYSDPSGNEVGSFEISDTKNTYSGVIHIGDNTGKYKMKVDGGWQHTMVFYSDGTDYYIYIHSMQYIYGRAESGLFVLTEN